MLKSRTTRIPLAILLISTMVLIIGSIVSSAEASAISDNKVPEILQGVHIADNSHIALLSGSPSDTESDGWSLNYGEENLAYTYDNFYNSQIYSYIITVD